MASKTSTASKTKKAKADTQPEPWSEAVKQAIVDRVAACENEESLPGLKGFSEGELKHILLETEKELGYPVDPDELEKALKATQPILTMPRFTSRLAALQTVFSVPEMVELWGRWRGPKGKRGPGSSYRAARATLALCATGVSPHLNLCRERLEGQDMIDFFAELEDRAADVANRGRLSWLMLDYKSVVRNIKKLVRMPVDGDDFSIAAMRQNIEFVKRIAEKHPNAGIGTRLALDGTSVPAWVRQLGKRSPDEEAVINKRHPEARSRAYGYGRSGKKTLQPGEKSSAATSKHWRGYTLIPLVDIATTQALVWIVVPANINEHLVVEELLELLFALWPDAPVAELVGDSAYDVAATHELCEVKYGIHLIAVRKPSLAVVTTDVTAKQSKSIESFNGRGVAICRQHQKQMKLYGHELGKRDGLKPGEASKEATFRTRWACPDGCGNPGLPMHLSWSGFSFYPHHSKGSPSKHAMRVALQARRNVCETLFSSLKVGSKLCTSGSDRCRLDKPSIEALVSLHFLFKMAQVVATTCAPLAAGPTPAAGTTL